MKLFNKRLGCVLVVSALVGADALCAQLSGTVSVNQSSTTAANAKTNATNSARRQILFDVLSQYSDKTSLNELLQKSSNDDLMNIISSSSVANEHISANAYSATITMNIDNAAAKKLLNDNNVQNWVPLAETSEKFTVLVVASNGIPDWAEIKRITRSANVDLETQSMAGRQIVVKLPLNYRTKFTAAIREAGWKYSDDEGVLHIWK